MSLEHLAKELNVSKTLVSLVLNNKGDRYGISKKTQDLVFAKAEELNYLPNRAIKELRTGKRTCNIGLIVPDISHPLFSIIARHIEDEAFVRGYCVLSCSSEENQDKELELLRMLRYRQVDGMIVLPALRKPYAFYSLQKQNYPIVFIGRSLPGIQLPKVIVDHFKEGYDITNHLIEQGHKKISFLSVKPTYRKSFRERIAGSKQAMKDAGLRLHSNWLLEVPIDEVSKTIRSILPAEMKRSKGITALVTLHCDLALIALKTLKENNIRIPEDLAFCSFDDIRMFEHFSPSITASYYPGHEMAVESITLLKKMMQDPEIEEMSDVIMLESSLKIRQSTQNGAYLK